MTPDALEVLPTSSGEIADLLARFASARSDASVGIQSVDGRYLDAYTAGFLLAKVIVRASGYRVKGGENHRDTFLAAGFLAGKPMQGSLDYLSAARKRRNASLYDAAGLVDEADVAALVGRVDEFSLLVTTWLIDQHPELLPG
jgi:hypothetical protein